MKRLTEGVTTSFEVLQLQKDYSQARSREFAALSDLNKAMVDLQLATGTLLEEQGVQVVSDAARTRQRYAPEPVVMIEEESAKAPSSDEAGPSPARSKRSNFSKAKRH